MDVHTAAAQFKLTNSTIRVRSTGETGSYWGCDAIPPTSVTIKQGSGLSMTLRDFAVEEVEVVVE